MPEVREGGCLCGAIRYRVHGKPQRVTACHCTFCQRRTGSAFSIHVLYDAKDFDLSGSGLATYEQRSAQSNDLLRLHFCSRCSTTVMLINEKHPNLRLITAGTLDDPNSVKIGSHTWVQSAQHWMIFAEDVTRFDAAFSRGTTK